VKLSAVLRRLDDATLAFWCPGCNEPHAILTPSVWAWDGNAEAPTFSPSVLVRGGHYADGRRPCWCTWNAEHPDDPTVFTCSQCHSYVRAGRIEFLADSVHALAGQTVPLPPWPEPEPV
jgi:hypothetical protein